MERFTCGEYTYEYVDGWGQDLTDFKFENTGVRKVSDIGVSKDGRVFLLTRSNMPVIITDGDGKYITHWEIPNLGRPHTICFDDEGYTYITDDEKHVVYKMNQDGKIVMMLGTPGVCTDTGYEWKDYRTVKRAMGPFNRPTGVSVSSDGEIFVADGYGNARVHRFSKDGKLIKSWGEPGFHPGQFYLPHGILVDDGLVYVCDRENGRIQVFDIDGNFKTEWKKLHRPSTIKKGPDGLFYVCECKRNDNFDEHAPSRFCIIDKAGEVVARIDNTNAAQPLTPYHAAHGLGVDADGNVYMGEVGQPLDGYLGVKKYLRIK